MPRNGQSREQKVSQAVSDNEDEREDVDNDEDDDWGEDEDGNYVEDEDIDNTFNMNIEIISETGVHPP